MAIGWITLLKTVPWADVIATAPVVADGAKKLWKSVSTKKATTEGGSAAESAVTVSPEMDVATRLAAIEATTADLHAQMEVSSELIKALAEQNTELVRRVEANRQRLLWLSVTALASLVTATLCLVLILKA